MTVKLNDIDISIAEIYKQEQHESTFVMNNDKSIVTNIHGNDFIRTLISIEKFVLEIAVCNELGYEKVTTANGCHTLKTFPLAKSHFHLMGLYVHAYSPAYVYSEYVTVFFDAAKSLHLMEQLFGNPTSTFCRSSNGSVITDADIFNTLITKIRAKLQTRTFKKKVAARNANYVRNYKSMCSYMDSLFERYSRLLVLRIDLSYLGKSKVGAYPPEYAVHDTPLESVKADRERFLNNIRRNQFGRDLVGHIWKLEYGFHKGHHTHLILFFDGSKRQKDAYLAQMIGEYWINDITLGKGYYYNCNMDKSVYTKLGVGMIDHRQTEARTNLKLILKYFTKKEQCLYRKTSIKCKVIGRGEPPKPKCPSGRKRRGS